MLAAQYEVGIKLPKAIYLEIVPNNREQLWPRGSIDDQEQQKPKFLLFLTVEQLPSCKAVYRRSENSCMKRFQGNNTVRFVRLVVGGYFELIDDRNVKMNYRG